MSEPQTFPYGSWPSPIDVDLAVGSSRGLSEPRQDGDDIYLLESRPDEAGRVALLRHTPDGTFTDVAPELNVRTRVHEYGGGAYAVTDGVVVFSEFDDNRLLLKGGPDEPITELVTDPALRFADMLLDRARDRVVAVMEDQTESAIEARNLLVAVSLADGSITELASGHDFYSSPVLSRDAETTRTVGIAVLDHPKNFRHPTRWHIRGYGLYTANPFAWSQFMKGEGKDGSHTWKKGETADFNYRILIHKDDTKAARVADHWKLYSDPPKVTGN